MKRKICTAALAVSCATLLPAIPASADSEVGSIVQREFLGALGTRETGEQHDLYFNESVYSNEAVETGATSATNLRFLDNTNLYVGASSRVVLDRFVYDPEQRLGDVAISFGKGAFRFITGNIENKENVSLRTPTATMTIRGTELLIFVLSDGTSEINVLEGAVDLLPCETDEPVRVNAGEALFITTSCETTALEARALPFGARYPQLPPELAALEGSTLPAAGGDEPDNRAGKEDDHRETKEPSEPPAPEPTPEPDTPDDDGDDGDNGDNGDGPPIDGNNIDG